MTENTERPENQTPLSRPRSAVILTALTALNAAVLAIAAFSSEEGAGVLAGFSALGTLLAYALWKGKNIAWSLVILAAVINMTRLGIVNIVIQGAVLVLALLPATRAFYRPQKGKRSELSFSGKGALQVVGVIFGGIIVVFLLAGFLS